MPMSSGAASPARASRLIFEYDGDRVRLIQQTPVELTAAAIPKSGGNETGVFVDVRDAADRTLARVPAPGAFASSMEVFSERRDSSIVRSDVPRPKGAFSVAVPTPDDTDHVTIVNVREQDVEIDLATIPLKPLAQL